MIKQKVNVNNLPNLIEVQRVSYCWFLSEGLASELAKFSTTFKLGGNLELKIYSNAFKLKKPKFSKTTAIDRNLTYSIEIYIPIAIVNKNFPDKI